MNIRFIDNAPLDGPLLCVTHADRPVDRPRCSLNYLQGRFSDADRLKSPKSFASLRPAITHTPWPGAITVWSFDGTGFDRPRLRAHLDSQDEMVGKSGHKPAAAVWHDGKLWVQFLAKLEVYDARLKRLAVIEDPWMAGCHTLSVHPGGRLVVDSASADALLTVDAKTLKVVGAVRMPERIYGRNHPLTRADSVVDHYIPNEQQLTHLNSNWPHQGGTLVSTLAQGAIGWFDGAGSYRELVRGFVGCHGVRTDTRDGRIFFSDSCTGTVVFLTAAMNIARRHDADSYWLHDACQLNGDVLALSVGDRNRLEIVDVAAHKDIAAIDCAPFGGSVCRAGWFPSNSN